MVVLGGFKSFQHMLLIALFAINVIVAEDVCRGSNNIQELTQFLGDSNVKKIKEQMETKAMLNELLTSNLECKTQLATILKQQEMLEGVQTKILEKQDDVQKQVILMAKILTEVVTPVQEIANNARRLRDCPKLKELLIANSTKFFSASERSFYHLPIGMTWHEARKWCEKWGMQLPILKSLSIMKAVSAQLHKYGFVSHGFWTAASDIDQTPGQFLWMDETPVDKSLWVGGEPNEFGKGKEMCVSLTTGVAKLHDSDCSTRTASGLCEVPKALSTCPS